LLYLYKKIQKHEILIKNGILEYQIRKRVLDILPIYIYNFR